MNGFGNLSFMSSVAVPFTALAHVMGLLDLGGLLGTKLTELMRAVSRLSSLFLLSFLWDAKTSILHSVSASTGIPFPLSYILELLHQVVLTFFLHLNKHEVLLKPLGVYKEMLTLHT